MTFMHSGARAASACALLVCSLALAACSGLRSDAPGEQVYILHPLQASAVGPATINAMLVVPQPEAQPALNTPRIALTQPANRLDYFADSRWAAGLPTMIGALVVESLVANNTFAVVAGTDPSAGHGDFQLLLTVRHFEAEYAGSATDSDPTARVSIECLVTSSSPRSVLGRCDADVREPAESNRMSAIVAAFDTATQRALTEISGKAATLAAGAAKK